MAEITMDTDWGARGAQLTGAQVQAFIKGELKKLQEKDTDIENKVTGPNRMKPDWMEQDKNSINYIKNKPEVPTVETVPDANLKSYVNVDGTTVNFKVGDFVRFKNKDGKYIFYQINDISENGSVSWSEVGSGGSGTIDARETVKIQLSSNQTQPDNSLIGAMVTVTNSEGSQLYTGTWQGNEILVKIQPLTEYTVSVTQVEGYATPQPKKYTAGFQGERSINLIYNSCLLTVQTSGLQNSETHSITVKYGLVNKTISSGQRIKVPVGVSVEVSTSAVTGYTTPNKQTFTPQESSKTITLTYILSALKVIIDSNQSNKSDLANLKATVKYNSSSIQVSSGQTIPIPLGTEVRISFPELNGYAKPSDITLTNQSGLAEKTGVYKTEIVTVKVSANNSANCSGRKITVQDSATSSVIGTVTGSTGSFKVPFGVTYKVSVDKMEDYDSPSEQSYTANQVSRIVNMQYIYNPIKKGYYILDDTIKDPATKVTLTKEVTEVIKWIRKNSHRVLVKKKSEGVCKVIKLLDTDSTKYFDGTVAPITNINYDVMMMMPDFWYTAEPAGADKWKIWFADRDPKDGKKWHKWDHGHLIGVYEAYNASNKVCSVSRQQPTGNVSQTDFKRYARNKGKGYQIIDWQAHCIMAFLFYGHYSNTNCQAICGSGTNAHQKPTGQTNSLGMTDTTQSNGNSMSINFWGLENWWGNKFEWIDNVVVDARVWKVTEPNGSTRTAGTGAASNGYVDKMIIGDNLDLICKQTSGSATTGYCDTYSQSSDTSCVAARSGNVSDPGGGVAYTVAFRDPSSINLQCGSRLAFIGEIEEADSVSAFTV